MDSQKTDESKNKDEKNAASHESKNDAVASHKDVPSKLPTSPGERVEHHADFGTPTKNLPKEPVVIKSERSEVLNQPQSAVKMEDVVNRVTIKKSPAFIMSSIAMVLKDNGMDSMQQIKASARIRNILFE